MADLVLDRLKREKLLAEKRASLSHHRLQNMIERGNNLGARCVSLEAEIARLRSDLSAALARNAVIEAETVERCARIAEYRDPHWPDDADRIAAAIRSSATKQEKADG